jgi:hypothetical protein
MFRKLAREVVIFGFLFAFIGGIWGAAYRHRELAQLDAQHRTDLEDGWVDYLPPAGSEPIPPGYCVERKTTEHAGPEEVPSCVYTWDTKTRSWIEIPDPNAPKKPAPHKYQDPRDVAGYGLFTAGLGAVAGAGIWALYRLARFAAMG